MDDKCLISVIVPVYNAAQWLPRCLDSILAQTYTDLEILLIDDGSTDDSPRIADEYAWKDPRIRVIHQKNMGPLLARECGIQNATGKFIGFVDADDEISPEMYEKLLDNAIRYDANISQCGILYCFYDGRKKPLHGTGRTTVYGPEEGCEALLRGTEMEPSLCNKIYYAPLLKDCYLDDSVINNEDMMINVVLFQRANRIVLEDFCGYHYWRHGGSVSFTHQNVKVVKSVLLARKRILEFVPPTLKKFALQSYSQGAMRGYNMLLNDRTPEGETLRRECREIMARFGVKEGGLQGKDRMRARAVLLFPHAYRVVEKAHLRNRTRRIRRQAMELKENDRAN